LLELVDLVEKLLYTWYNAADLRGAMLLSGGFSMTAMEDNHLQLRDVF